MKRFALAAASIFAIGACSAGTYTVNSLSVTPSGPYVTLDLSGPLFNDAATIALQGFGSGTDTINKVATATGVSQAAGVAAYYFCVVAGNWSRVQSS